MTFRLTGESAFAALTQTIRSRMRADESRHRIVGTDDYAPPPDLPGHARAPLAGAPPDGGAPYAPVTVVLPYPPTTNHDKRPDGRGGSVLTPDTRAFRQYVAYLWATSGRPVVAGRLRVLIELYPDRGRRGDIDNRVKPVLDAMQAAGFFPNDSAVDDLRVVRRDVRGATARAVVTLEPIAVCANHASRLAKES